MLKELTQLWGVSGIENNVSDYITEKIFPYVDEIKLDAVGNLITLKKGTGNSRKKIMLAAHSDEVGLCVVRIMENGLLKVKQVGGLSAFVLYMNRVQFANGTKGVIACSAKIEEIKDSDIRQLYVDIGVSSKEEAEKYVSVGDCAVIAGEFEELCNGRILSKAIDNRIGCYILLDVLEKMKSPYHDIYFTFTVQEEVGLRGATVLAERIQPDVGIAIDITRAFDLPGEDYGTPILGGGVAIKVSDGIVICDNGLTNELRKIAEEHELSYQMDPLYAGGTDIGAIMKSGYGVKTLGLSIPTRYGHTPHNIIDMKDVEACSDLLRIFIESDIEIIAEKNLKG